MLSYILVAVACFTFYLTCEKVSIKPTKQKVIATPIFSMIVLAMLFAL